MDVDTTVEAIKSMELMGMVQALRQKVELWNKSGKSAAMTVANGLNTVEVTIRFEKQR